MKELELKKDEADEEILKGVFGEEGEKEVASPGQMNFPMMPLI